MSGPVPADGIPPPLNRSMVKNMKNSPINGCDNCADPVMVTLREKEIKRLTSRVSIFRCPKCGCLILDDIMGWKGSGTVFRAIQEMIDDYMKDYGKRERGVVTTGNDGDHPSNAGK